MMKLKKFVFMRCVILGRRLHPYWRGGRGGGPGDGGQSGGYGGGGQGGGIAPAV